MVVLPKQFVAVPRYSGYFWNVEDKRLYSCKVSGVLAPLKLKTAFRGFVRGTRVDRDQGYAVSVDGQRRFITLDRLLKIKSTDEIHVFPVATHRRK